MYCTKASFDSLCVTGKHTDMIGSRLVTGSLLRLRGNAAEMRGRPLAAPPLIRNIAAWVGRLEWQGSGR